MKTNKTLRPSSSTNILLLVGVFNNSLVSKGQTHLRKVWIKYAAPGLIIASRKFQSGEWRRSSRVIGTIFSEQLAKEGIAANSVPRGIEAKFVRGQRAGRLQ